MAGGLRPAERHSIAVLVLLIVIAVLIAHRNDRQRVDDHTPEEVEMVAEVVQEYLPSPPKLETFDPNTVELTTLLKMGLTKSEAVSLLRYRAAGKVFRIKEELILCWGISDSLYFALEPYIAIGEEFRYKRDSVETKTYAADRKTEEYEEAQPFMLDTVGAEYIASCGLLSLRQAEVLLRWHATSQIANEAELRECYVVSDEAAARMVKYIIFPEDSVAEVAAAAQTPNTEPQPLINLNTADSATLRSVRGIGAKSVEAIILRREELGGFHSVDQLLELNVIMESNFEKIILQIFVDSCDISKIDVNFASAKELISHPYITNKMARRILHLKQLKGGWSNIEEMVEDKIFSSEEAQHVRPYLDFVLPEI
ncbi:MAG: helix-hairpin-helix domain-containing protein [Rikenellaceae bacterium]